MNNVNVLQIASVALKLAPKVNLKKMLMENAAVVVAHAVRMNVNVHLNVFAKKINALPKSLQKQNLNVVNVEYIKYLIK